MVGIEEGYIIYTFVGQGGVVPEFEREGFESAQASDGGGELACVCGA